MRAIRQHEFGDATRLLLEDIADPGPPAARQLIVRVRAAGVHALDVSIREGGANGPMAKAHLPMTPGREIAGEVVAIGPEVPTRMLGRRVVCHLGPGASGGYAEVAVAKLAQVHEIPPGMSFETAVALIGSGRTAMLILDAAEIDIADVVLVPGAGGGLGNQLVQLVLSAGASVIALARGEAKIRGIGGFGATIIDLARDDWRELLVDATADRPGTVLLDGVGGAVGQAALDALGPLGRAVVFGWSSGEPLAFTSEQIMARSLTVSSRLGPALAARPGYLRELEHRAMLAWVDGEVEPLVHAFPLERAGDAHRAIEGRSALGKVVLVP